MFSDFHASIFKTFFFSQRKYPGLSFLILCSHITEKELKISVIAMETNSNLKNGNFTIFFKVSKNENFTKIQDEKPKNLVTNITNISFLL